MHEQLISVIEPSPSHIRTPLLLWSLRPTSTHGRPTSTSSFKYHKRRVGVGAVIEGFIGKDLSTSKISRLSKIRPGFDPGTCGFPSRKQFTLNKVILIRNFTCLILCGTTVFGFAALYLLKKVQVP
ncbi:hypothetical protein P8452_09052 [Trifolium repens]|nr:hypothetical protein P8452_09052 [Trifolium repens]